MYQPVNRLHSAKVASNQNYDYEAYRFFQIVPRRTIINFLTMKYQEIMNARKCLKSNYAILGVIVTFFLFGSCTKDKDHSHDESIKIPFYSEVYTLPQTQSAQKLSDYLTGKHLDYHQYGWNICASMTDNNNNTLAFFFAIEYAEDGGYRGGVGFGNSEEGFKWSGFINTGIETTANPWSVKLTSSDLPGMFVKMELTSGLMGSANAIIRLTADVIDLYGKSLQLDVRLRDPFGAINQGYGTTSLYPHYLTEAQRTAIMALPEKSIGAYLTATDDRMSCQGAYYYALPLMDVEQFSIMYDNVTLSGTSGKSWMDYFVKSYNETPLQMQAGSRWDWIAIQLPEINTAINILKISNSTSATLPFARLFNTDSERTKNGAYKAAHSWALDEISVEPVPGSEWTSPSGQEYYMQYRIKLESVTKPGDLTVTMLRNNQTVMLPEGSNYQGIGIVEGTLGGQVVHGQCWVEVQPAGL